MAVCTCPCRSLLVGLALLVSALPPLEAWDADLELLDLVEEIPQNFYQFLSLDQLVAIYEVLKDEERRSK
ncbi:DnaJ subfamily C member 1 [Liparis tanakae]|uniref:DnaJ subfamily C member 1 n=1 Tax=Liparis tanakae TaxID=230148 RepID=A0A4Z2ED51_9TELE|nr:DnaJ subfamily C member 1 [Liparis tanakae]